MIFEDLFTHLSDSAEISAIATGGVFWTNPLEAPTSEPYIVYSRPEEQEDDIRNRHLVQIVCFAKSMSDRDGLSEAVKHSLRGVKEIGNGEYYIVQLITQTDSDIKLENGYFFNILNYDIRETQ